MDEYKIRMERIRELTETVVPFRETIRGVDILDFGNGKKAKMIPVHKEPDFAITEVQIEEGFVHQNHFHQEYEVICLIEGQATLYSGDKEMELQLYTPVIIQPMQHHMLCYLKESKVLAITIPASKHFPNDNTDGAYQ